MAEFAVTVIGSGSALPMHGRNPSAQIVQYEDAYYLIDCGEGTQNRLRASGVKPFKIKVIFISHLHGDHFFGLPGLLSSFSHLQRKESLTVFGPEGLKGLLDEIIKYTEMKINFPLFIIEQSPQRLEKIWNLGNLDVYTFPLQHRVKCNGYLFKEKSPLLRLRKEIVEPLKLNPDQIHALMQGKDIEVKGVMMNNLQLTFGEEQPLSYAYCSDTRYDRRIIEWIKNVTLLYHETTFKNDLLATAEQTGHTTAAEAGQLASEAGVFCLLTGHYSSRYKDVSGLIEEAEVYFPRVLESIEGTRYSLRQLVTK